MLLFFPPSQMCLILCYSLFCSDHLTAVCFQNVFGNLNVLPNRCLMSTYVHDSGWPHLGFCLSCKSATSPVSQNPLNTDTHIKYYKQTHTHRMLVHSPSYSWNYIQNLVWSVYRISHSVIILYYKMSWNFQASRFPGHCVSEWVLSVEPCWDDPQQPQWMKDGRTEAK